MKKTLYTLCVDNYAPEITEITFPLLKHYADKIRADFYIITERKWPDWPPVYEKMQIYELSQEHKNDWNIYIDADAMIHPDMFDVTTQVPKDTVAFNGKDFANIRWKYDKYFMRDGRNIGACNWFAIASDWCVDLWHPLDIPFEEAVDNIYATVNEINTVVVKEHLIDDYTLSRNIARYGLKHMELRSIYTALGTNDFRFVWHQYTWPVEQKVVEMRKVLQHWDIHGTTKFYDMHIRRFQ
ncbi:MAG TPA: hypothetical protein P5031_07985 [Candidatus Syntrophosphaera sp.]|jgi:hypothetical protein|nr:hypothetical protein [Candidatus Syntrophosphaera sp.]